MQRSSRFGQRPNHYVQRVLAIGGGGFLMEDGPSPIDHYLSLAGPDKPRVLHSHRRLCGGPLL
jgi:hypothetical protein